MNAKEFGHPEAPRGVSSTSSVPLHRHTGTLMSTGGPLWIVPCVFTLLPVLTVVRVGFDPQLASLLASLAGMALLSLCWVAAARFQSIELYPGHFVHRKWGLRRVVAYSDVKRVYSELKSASQSYHASMVPRQGVTPWSTPRTMHVVRVSGDEVVLVEMVEHELLERRLQELAAGSAGAPS